MLFLILRTLIGFVMNVETRFDGRFFFGRFCRNLAKSERWPFKILVNRFQKQIVLYLANRDVENKEEKAGKESL